MSSVARPPEPCLVAIILIVSSRAGPRFVFHYPPNPLSENAVGANARRATRSTDSASSEESESSSDEDDEPVNLAGGVTGGRQNNSGNEDNVSGTTSSVGGESQRPPSLSSGRTKKRGGNSDPEDSPGLTANGHGNGSAGNSRPSWDSVFGLPSDVWEKLLSPTRAWHKRRFEVGINDLAFVGWPVFVRDDGTWRKQKKRRKKKPREWEGSELGHEERLGDSQGDDAEAAQDDDDYENVSGARLGAPGDGKSNGDVGAGANRGPSEPSDTDKDSMTMFNVVFVLDPPILEYSINIREMYENVIKKFGKALKWEQARTDYVWKEAQNILQIKEKAREKEMSVHSLYSELIANSSLARAIYTIFTSISASKIASVSLSPEVSISLQIPPLTSISHLPSPTEPSYPGLWLTTADNLSPADDAAASGLETPNQVLAKHFGLLLLDNEATILKDVEASGGALGPALAHYIRCTKPNKSFAQISAISGISLSNIQLLASHLVYWRRARVIPPLHQRDTYIVSPNCDLSKLSAATEAYAAAFPTLPSLPKMLSALSGTPRPYASFIPSKEHKETYFAVLAWLLRGGWVTQLRTFARVKVTPEIKIAVEQALRREQMEKYISSGRPMSSSSNEGREERDDDGDDGSSSSSSLGSQGSDQLTPIPGRRDSDDQYHLSDSYMDRNSHLNMSSLILFPHRASPLESRWLDEIMSRFPDRPGSETGKTSESAHSGPGNEAEDSGLHDSLKKYWPKFVKYFNGHDALEKIAVREGLKRKVVWQVLMRMGLGKTVGMELDPREQVLVTVRHW
ncbi:hypothetical protein VTN96DRAFT_3960 [Rasamsonia emersonii]